MRLGLALACALSLVAGFGCRSVCHVPSPTTVSAPDGQDKETIALIEKRCGVCHETDRVYGSEGTVDEWMAVVHRMAYHHKAKLISHLSDSEAMQIARWLASQFHPDRARTRIGYVPSGRPL